MKDLTRQCLIYLSLLWLPAALAVPPHTAIYNVYRDGDAIGEARVELRWLANDRYEYRTQTEGTSGLASLLGARVRESATGIRQGQRFLPDFYDYEQKVSFSRRERSMTIDREAGEASGIFKDKTWSLPINGEVYDRLSVNLALIADLQRQATDLSYPIIHKSDPKTYRFARQDVRELATDEAGAQRRTCQMVRRVGIQSDRRTRSCHAPSLSYLPIWVSHEDRDETLLMRLKSIDIDRRN